MYFPPPKSIIFFKGPELPRIPSPPPLDEIKTEVSFRFTDESAIVISSDDEEAGGSGETRARRTGGDPAALYYVVDLVC